MYCQAAMKLAGFLVTLDHLIVPPEVHAVELETGMVKCVESTTVTGHTAFSADGPTMLVMRTYWPVTRVLAAEVVIVVAAEPSEETAEIVAEFPAEYTGFHAM